MARDVYHYVERCESCCKYRPSHKHQKWMQLLPPSGSLEFIAIDMLGPLTKTEQRIRFLVFITDQNRKLTRVIPIPKVTAPLVATVVMKHRIIPYERELDTFLGDNGPQFVSKFLAALCTSLGSKQVTTTECHSQSSGQVERHNKRIVSRLRHIDDHQQDRDVALQPLKYGYKCIVWPRKSPFSLVPSWALLQALS